MRRSHLFVAAVLSVFACVTAGCGKKHHAPAAGSGAHKHEHKPPHGGTAVVLGNEVFHLEFLRDAEAGRLTAYVMDGEFEKFIRCAQRTLALDVTVGNEKRELTLEAVANTATGETVGDTAQFEGHAEWLKTTPRFEAVLRGITIRGGTFADVAFRFPEGNETR